MLNHTRTALAGALGAPLLIAAAAPAQVIEIFEAIPNIGAQGDVITLVGRNFGNDPDDLCVAVENGSELLFLKAVAANETTALVEVGNIPPDATPGRIMVERGEGRVDTFAPIRQNIQSPSDNWVWSGDGGFGGQSTFDFLAIPDPPPPPGTRWFYGDVEDGKATVIIAGDWTPNSDVVLQVRLIGSGPADGNFTGAEYFNNLQEPGAIQTFYHAGGGAFECAQDICDHIKCALDQIADIITDCTVEDLPGNRARISICFGGASIFAGTFNVCIVEEPVIPAFVDTYQYWEQGSTATWHDDRLVLSNIGASGDEGATFDIRGAAGLSTDHDPVRIDPGQGIKISGFGSFNHGPAQSLGSLEVRNDNGQQRVFADFSKLGVSTVGLEMYLDGQLVGETTVPIGLVGHFPTGVELVGNGVMVEQSAGLLPHFRTWDDIYYDFAVPFVASNGIVLTGDELRVVAEAPGTLEFFVADLQGLNIPRLEITRQTLGNRCPADLDGSGAVDFGDILAILAAWGNPGGVEDLDGSGFVDFGDLLVVLAAWGPCN